jgi:hypothetical protein
MARSVTTLNSYLAVSNYAGELLRVAFGPPSVRAFRHGTDPNRQVEVARYPDVPVPGQVTYATHGLCNHEWADGRPRLEVLFATTVDSGAVPQLLANTAFHIIDAQFYPTPGSVVRDLVAVSRVGELSNRFPHLYFAVPRRWLVPLAPRRRAAGHHADLGGADQRARVPLLEGRRRRSRRAPGGDRSGRARSRRMRVGARSATDRQRTATIGAFRIVVGSATVGAAVAVARSVTVAKAAVS